MAAHTCAHSRVVSMTGRRAHACERPVHLLGHLAPAQRRAAYRPPSASGSSDPTPGAQPPTPTPPASEAAAPEGIKLTTWQYAKLKDPGFGPWFLGMAFLPFVLLLVPLLSSPPMPPVPSP
ncbi:hypothetical protein PLESTM_000907600 [Pleodorina starrii]|nr:hypothetical protein PLESTM_000907600 [Pleodorina starrii]